MRSKGKYWDGPRLKSLFSKSQVIMQEIIQRASDEITTNGLEETEIDDANNKQE